MLSPSWLPPWFPWQEGRLQIRDVKAQRLNELEIVQNAVVLGFVAISVPDAVVVYAVLGRYLGHELEVMVAVEGVLAKVQALALAHS